MKKRSTYHLLSAKLFLVGLFLLLLNDCYLKYEHSSFLTGKISDFAGLFIFPYFISIFIPIPRIIYSLTTIFFIFWKLEYSQPFIDAFAKFSNLAIYRTIDQTDLIALIMLPFSYSYFRSITAPIQNSKIAFPVFISLLSIFSFCATTLPKQTIEGKLKVSKRFQLSLSKKNLFKKLNAGYGYSDTLSKNLTDTLFYLYFDIPEYFAKATAIARIKSLEKDKTILELDSITSYIIQGGLFKGIKQSDIEACQNLKPSDIEGYFKLNYLNKIKSEDQMKLYFDNKEVIDRYELNK